VGSHWRHLVNNNEPSVCGKDGACCKITLDTCNHHHYHNITWEATVGGSQVELEVTRAGDGCRSLQCGAGYPNTAPSAPGTGRIQHVEDVRGTSYVSVVALDAPGHLHPPVRRGRHQYHLVLAFTARLELLRLADYHICRSSMHVGCINTSYISKQAAFLVRYLLSPVCLSSVCL